MKKVLLFTNMTAGQGTAKQKLNTIIESLAENGCAATVFPIIPEKNLTSRYVMEELITKGGEKFDVVACCGGDGTLNHMINAMMDLGLSEKIPIGYIPTGSTNDFSRNLNGNLTTEELCAAIAGDQTFAYDIGRLEDRYFNYVAGFGAFTGISYNTDQAFKNVFGYGAYILNMLTSLPQNISYKQHAVIEHDGETEEGEYIFGGVTNSLSIAGVQSPVLGNAELNDGLFEVLLISAPKDILDIGEIIQCLKRGEVNNQYVKVFHASKVRFASDEPLSWTMDGEFGGTRKVTQIEVIPRAVRIMVHS